MSTANKCHLLAALANSIFWQIFLNIHKLCAHSNIHKQIEYSKSTAWDVYLQHKMNVKSCSSHNVCISVYGNTARCWWHFWMLFHFWRQSAVTWPDLVDFFQKRHKWCPISYAKFQRDPQKGSASISERSSWGTSTPLSRRGLKSIGMSVCSQLLCHH